MHYAYLTLSHYNLQSLGLSILVLIENSEVEVSLINHEHP